MDTLCPTCQQPVVSGATRRYRRQLVRQIYAVQREILSLQNGAVWATIEQQTPAASCTICAQAAPGKPGQPTPVTDLVRPLQRRLDELEQQLHQIDRSV